jgi:hypothetical protein
LAPHRAMLVPEKRRPCRSLRWSCRHHLTFEPWNQAVGRRVLVLLGVRVAQDGFNHSVATRTNGAAPCSCRGTRWRPNHGGRKEGVPTRRDQVLSAYDGGWDGRVRVHEREAPSAQFCM